MANELPAGTIVRTLDGCEAAIKLDQEWFSTFHEDPYTDEAIARPQWVIAYLPEQ